jgi:peptide deformylase
MELRVTKYGEPILRKKGKEVAVFDKELDNFASDMVDTMREAEGIGLAAQQVGRAIQMCVIELIPVNGGDEFNHKYDGSFVPLDLIMPLVVINPKIIPLSEVETPYEEGCLSFPDIHGEVFRPDHIKVEFQDLQGHLHTMECEGLLSKCFQHEYDHLHGVLYIDRMKKSELAPLQMEINRLKRVTKQNIRKKKG